MKDCLIIFAKEPKIGKVKTRLEGGLSRTECLELYKSFLKDTFNLSKSLKNRARILAYDSSGSEPAILKKIFRGFVFHKQKGGDQGARMHDAFKFAAAAGYRKMVLIGSDSPNLPLNYIKEAYERLDKCDVVIGPSLDGGYYLLGLKKPCVGIFKGVKWSSGVVLAQTLKIAAKLKKKAALLKYWYDIDQYSDLDLLKSDLTRHRNSAPWTRKILKI